MKFLLASVMLCCSFACGMARAATVCPRFAEGSVLQEPQDLYSAHGQLETTLKYQTRVDYAGNTLYCFSTPSGAQSPTLHLNPGDQLVIHLINELPPGATMQMGTMPEMAMSSRVPDNCGSSEMTTSSVNLHFHGTNVPPVCHQDEVIKTAVDGGGKFEYRVQIPRDEPPGLYWYHPHIHGVAEPAVLGGASGALIIEGLEKVNPAVARLPQKVFVIRDNLVPGALASDDDTVPAWDLSVNYVPVAYPAFTPAVMKVRPEERQLWRVLNASADTILDVALEYDGAAQTLAIVGLDGVPTGSQDGTSIGKTVRATHVLLPPASRAEFIVTTPSTEVRSAVLKTRQVDTGPDGDNDPERPLVSLQASGVAPAVNAAVMPEMVMGAKPPAARFANLAKCKAVAKRKLYFSEVLSDPNDPDSPTNFYITVDGKTPVLFNPDNPPAIETTQGAVEDWTIENRALENHVFHIHQVHFLVLEKNGRPVPNGQFLDTIQVPYWSGKGPYPSVKVRMDFRGDTVGDFVYHCHILGHEDSGMMAIIRVRPAK